MALYVWEWFVGLFRRKRLLEVNMIDPSGDIVTFRKRYKENKFDYKGGTYSVQRNRVYYNKKTQKAKAFYFLGNPEPIDLSHVKHSSLSAEALREMVKSDMVKDAFATDKNSMEMLIIILLCVICVISLISMLVALKVIKVG